MVASNNYINDYYYLYRHRYWFISLEICIEKINTSLSFPSKLIWEEVDTMIQLHTIILLINTFL